MLLKILPKILKPLFKLLLISRDFSCDGTYEFATSWTCYPMYLTSRSFCGHSPISCAHLLVQFVFSIIFNALSRKKAQLFHRTIPVILAKSSFASSFESEWKTYQLICFNVRIILVRLVFRIKSRNKIIKSQFHLQFTVAELTLFRWKKLSISSLCYIVLAIRSRPRPKKGRFPVMLGYTKM